jgi:hypothetical protein
MRYLDRIDLTDRGAQFEKVLGKQPTFQGGGDSQFLKKDSLVLPGAAIFHLLFEGTRV